VISRNIDIWAVLLLLFGFALLTRLDEFTAQGVHAGISLHGQHIPAAVHLPRFRLNRSGRRDNHAFPGWRRLI
jgi:hypothetical protein